MHTIEEEEVKGDPNQMSTPQLLNSVGTSLSMFGQTALNVKLDQISRPNLSNADQFSAGNGTL